MVWFLALTVLVLAPAAARAAGPSVETIVEMREAFPPTSGPLVSGPTRLQKTACGDGTVLDDTVHEADRLAPKIRAVEVVPADMTPDPQVRDRIAGIVAEIAAHVAAQPGSGRTLRFDVGTACGADSIDVHSVRLPRTRAEYQEQCTTTIFDEVRAALPPAPGPRNAILFTSSFDCGLVLGTAEAPKDDRPGPENLANRGGYMAIAYQLVARTALHEIGHTLGAVQLSAPHSDQGDHCYDNDDTMCYAYTAGVPAQTPLLRPCVADPQPFDCGQDDYFSPAPAPGTYLDSHWNTYDSIFMCEIASCVPPAPAPPAPPAPAPPAAQVTPPPPAAAPARKRKADRKRKARKRKAARRRAAARKRRR